VCQTDPNRAVISDFGFIHVTTNGGTTWRQAYDWQGCENPAGLATPKTTFYTGNGAENTSCWWLSWFSSNTLFCSFTDIRGMLAPPQAWMLHVAHPGTYQTLNHPTNERLCAVPSAHDICWDRIARWLH
jgi:hypothetical protein